MAFTSSHPLEYHFKQHIQPPKQDCQTNSASTKDRFILLEIKNGISYNQTFSSPKNEIPF